MFQILRLIGWDDHVRFTVNANDIQVRQITYDNNGDEIVALPVTLAQQWHSVSGIR